MDIKITARKEILDGLTYNRLSDEELLLLDGIVFEIIDNKENYPLDKVVDGFIQRHPDFKGASLEIEYLVPGKK